MDQGSRQLSIGVFAHLSAIGGLAATLGAGLRRDLSRRPRRCCGRGIAVARAMSTGADRIAFPGQPWELILLRGKLKIVTAHAGFGAPDEEPAAHRQRSAAPRGQPVDRCINDRPRMGRAPATQDGRRTILLRRRSLSLGGAAWPARTLLQLLGLLAELPGVARLLHRARRRFLRRLLAGLLGQLSGGFLVRRPFGFRCFSHIPTWSLR